MSRSVNVRRFRPCLENIEDRCLLSLVVNNQNDFSQSTVANTVTWRTVATISATNLDDLMMASWITGQEPFAAVMDMGDEGAANTFNPNPHVSSSMDSLGMTGFEIDWGHEADTIDCMIVPNADYTAFDVEVGYRYLTPGTYNWNLVLMAVDGSNQIISGTATVTGPAQSQGGNRSPRPKVTDVTYVNLSDMS